MCHLRLSDERYPARSAVRRSDEPAYDAALLDRGVGVRFKGVERTNVEEYCVSEGWVQLAVGNTRDRKGRPLTIKLKGAVEPYFRDVAEKA